MNFIYIAGHLGADAETRFTPNGTKVTTLRIATNSRRNGKDETIWWRATLWGDRFDKMLPYLKKGSAVIVVGEMQKPEIYTDKMGQPQISIDITAEFVRFSPFGKGERSSEDRGGEFAGTQTAPSHAPTQAFGDTGHAPGPSRGFAAAAPIPTPQQVFGLSNKEEDDDLPF